MNRLKLIVGLSFTLPAFIAEADYIWFPDERREQVIILNETPEEITYKKEKSTISLPKSMIARIEYSSGEENMDLLDEWNRENITSLKFDSPEVQYLSDEFKRLKHLKSELQDKRSSSRTLEQTADITDSQNKLLKIKYERLKDEMNELRPIIDEHYDFHNRLCDELNELSIEWNDVYAEKDSGYRTRCNKIRAESQKLRIQIKNESDRMKSKEARYNEIKDELSDISDRINDNVEKKENFSQKSESLETLTKDYIIAIEKFKHHLTIAEPKYSDEYPDFFAELKSQFLEIYSELATDNIKFKKNSGTMEVDVVINGQGNVKLIFDTGASTVTLSKEAANRLGVKASEDYEKTYVTLADGKKVDAEIAIIDSIKVGDVEQKNVYAMILENPPSKNIDGLLGMSFLQNFSFTMNHEGELELTYLKSNK